MRTWMTPEGNGIRRSVAIESALNAACRRLMRTCPEKCPIIQKACFVIVPTRKSCAARLKAYFLRRDR